MRPKLQDWTSQQLELVKNNIMPEGKNYAQCSYVCRRYFKQGFRPVRAIEQKTRGKEYAEMHKSGMSYATIAKKVGLSRQRIAVLACTWEKNNLE